MDEIKKKLQEFAERRNWDQFHSPKNLAMALSVEAAELLEIFQWLTEEESNLESLSEKKLLDIREELADIFLYLIRISDKLEINITEAALEKLKLNEKKYPVELSKDNAIKYNKRDE